MTASGPAWTGGPWSLVNAGSKSVYVDAPMPDGSAGRYTISALIDNNGEAQNQANATLIAAAPCMAEAIAEHLANERAHPDIGTVEYMRRKGEIEQRMEAALRKATGTGT